MQDHCTTNRVPSGDRRHDAASTRRAACARDGAVGAPMGLSNGAYFTVERPPLVVEEYRRDAKLRRVGGVGGVGGRRGRVTELSSGAARRFVFAVNNAGCDWVAICHLTYPREFPGSGREVKRHLDRFLKWLNRKGVKWAWVEEFQARGAPHFHVLLSGCVRRQEVAEVWHRVTGCEDPRHLTAGTRIEAVRSPKGLIRYLGKYLSKKEQKVAPIGFEHVGRYWGMSRGLVQLEECWVAVDVEADRAFRVLRQFAERRAGKRFGFLHRGRCGMVLFDGVGASERVKEVYGVGARLGGESCDRAAS